MGIRTGYALHRAFGRLMITSKKKALLESYGWYRNMRGGYAHPHAIDYMTASEIRGYTLKQLEYKLENGSMAGLPEDLKKGRTQNEKRRI